MNTILSLFAAVCIALPSPADSDFPCAGTPVYTCRVVKAYPHDPTAFTQGLLFYRGALYESTGKHGHSSLRKVDLATGKVIKIRRLPNRYFGEGIARKRNRIVLLTWQERVGFVYDLETFRLVGRFRYGTEGWGVTYDGRRFVMSDGTATLRFLDPRTFKVVKRLVVKDRGRPVDRLNELEFVRGEIFANVWGTGLIARIAPETGEVVGWIDLTGLYAEIEAPGKADVLNGIAYDAERDRLFVTGKYWPKLFEIRLVPAGDGRR
ncbi:MAG TPA: glutaminyl-peptide cyclotransferase [Syntrophales bacterium]|nr:glutaminyl-peptide cyclotransferase [Syntrophales bacterium]HRT71456.1 glutaminyl-peptide cyclotransferase [Syntrophales bacterium]